MAITSSDEAVPAYEQHTTPCHDCPWRREALIGWLGGTSVEDWLRDAHSDVSIPCHVFTGVQCAGAAIYRRNVCKKSRDPDVLVLGVDKITVFATPVEFREHHEGGRPSVSAQTSETVSNTAPEHVGVLTMAKANAEVVVALKTKHAAALQKANEKATKTTAKLTAKHEKKLADILKTVGQLSTLVQEILTIAGALTALKPKEQKKLDAKAAKVEKLRAKLFE